MRVGPALAQIVTCSLRTNGVGAARAAASIKSSGLDAINNNICWRQLDGQVNFSSAVSVNSNCHYVYVRANWEDKRVSHWYWGKWELSGKRANENESKVFATERKMKELTTWLSMKTNARQSADGKANHPTIYTGKQKTNQKRKKKNRKAKVELVTCSGENCAVFGGKLQKAQAHIKKRIPCLSPMVSQSQTKH